LLYLKYRPIAIHRRVLDRELLFLCIILFNVLLIPFIGVYLREFAFMIQFGFLILAFDYIDEPLGFYVKYLNITYVIFCLLSYLVYFNVIMPGLRPSEIGVNQFEILLFSGNIRTLIGFGGSTAGIDSYSIIVLLVNIFYIKLRPEARIIIVLAVFNALFTTRLIPWVMLLVPAIFFLVPGKGTKIKKILFLIMIAVSFLIPEFIEKNFHVKRYVFPYITHGRSSLWIEFTTLFFNNSLHDMLFGFKGDTLPWIKGAGSTRYLNQSHSTYLRILLRSGVIMYSIYFALFYNKLKSIVKTKTLFIVMAIMVAGITQENIFYNANPIFLTTFLIFATKRDTE